MKKKIVMMILIVIQIIMITLVFPFMVMEILFNFNKKPFLALVLKFVQFAAIIEARIDRVSYDEEINRADPDLVSRLGEIWEDTGY